MQKIDGRLINVMIPNVLLSEVDRIAKRQKTTRAEIIRRFLQAGVDIFSDFEKVGVVKLTEIFDRTQVTIKRSIGQQRLPEIE